MKASQNTWQPFRRSHPGRVRNADRHEYATGVLGRDVTTFSDLSTADVNRLMTAIAAANTHEEVA